MTMREDILRILPEIELIEDESLRQMVTKTWEDALVRGKWEASDIQSMPFTLAKKVDISFAQHVRSVTKISLAAVEIFDEIYKGKLTLNRDLVLAGALLHDVGKLLEMEKVDGVFRKSHEGKLVRHPFSGVALADANGAPPEVQHIIGTHSKEGDPYKRTPESVIVHLADFMNFDTVEG
jgi:putative nucleotidyltransferase with HDIG domain